MAGHHRTADTPAGGGQGGAILRMGIHAYAMGEGRIQYGGSPNAEAGKMPVTLIRVQTAVPAGSEEAN